MFEKEKQELELAEQRLRQRSLDIVSNILKQSDEKIIEDAKSCYSLNEFRKFNYKILKEEYCFWVCYYVLGDIYNEEVTPVWCKIELDNPIMKEFFDIMEDINWKNDARLKRIEMINQCLLEVEA